MSATARSRHRDFALFGLWPSPTQSLVLRAALLDGDAAVAAFHEWVRHIDLAADFDAGTVRLLPLLYDNLRRLELKHPLMGRLKGAYRLAWYRNQRLFADLRPVLDSLSEAGIRTLLFKGVPLVFQAYRNSALRPMSDIDVLVPPAQAPRAADLLRRAGWQPFNPLTPSLFRYRHAVSFSDPAEREIDIHWHCLFELSGRAHDDFLWASARPFDFNGVATLAPDPTRHLIVTILHGLRWNLEPPIRWIPDAMTLLRTAAGDIAWDELLGFAREARFSYRLHLGLAYLRTRFDAPVPPPVLADLQRAGPSPLEWIENTVVLRDLRPLYARPLGNLWIIFADYCRYASGAAAWPFLTEFGHYLRYRWELRGRREIPGVVWRGLVKRARATVTPRERAAGLPAPREASAPGTPSDPVGIGS